MNKGVWLALGIGLALASIGTGVAVMREPRGIRNKNPLNIEKGADWVGLAPVQNDDRFAVFIDHRYGYRAAARIIGNYRKRGVKTLAAIIQTWAPPTENNTGAYIESVSRKAGIQPEDVVSDAILPAVLAAMTVHENGKNPYSLEDIAEGISWA